MFSVESPEKLLDAFFVKQNVSNNLIGVPLELQINDEISQNLDLYSLSNQPTKRDLDRSFVSDLSDLLSKTLPDYMVPSSFVILDRSTIDGKWEA